MRSFMLGLALAAALAASGRGAAAETYVIDAQVWGWYQQYLRNIGDGLRPGAFAISRDGRSAFYSWCQDIRCMAGPSYSQDALDNCRREYGIECVVFAIRDQIQVEYEVIARQGQTLNPPPVETAVTRIAVTPAVQDKIDVYLRNARSPARVWAFALARDGSDAAMASCPVGTTYSGGRACYPVLGSMEELAKREALARCGGAGACLLLYVGAQKQGNVEIVPR